MASDTKHQGVSALGADSGLCTTNSSPVRAECVGSRKGCFAFDISGIVPIVWVTGGWFAGISPLGYVLMFSINTLVYGLVVFVGLRTCAYVTGNTVEPV